MNVGRFSNKKELTEVAKTELLEMYKTTFETNWEYYPWTDAELTFAIDQVLLIADPNLIKTVRTRTGEMVGFLIGFPDLSKEMQASKGRITPWGMLRLMKAAKSNRENLILNGAGVLPKYQGRGGNALMYNRDEENSLGI